MKQALTRQLPLDWEGLSMGPVQRSGVLSVLPLLDRAGRRTPVFSPPLSGLKLSRVQGYGNIELENRSGFGTAIVPLHIGYIQDQAQNHALCRSAFLGEGQKLMFRDACCVQASQGGYLEEREQGFFILPLELREKALELRGTEGYGKLWDAISELNARMGLESRGHLEQIVCRQRATLTQYGNRLECLEGQVGALFFLEGRLVGIELAPDPTYFAELWMPLVCFCYGSAALRIEQGEGLSTPRLSPLKGSSIAALREALEASRASLQAEVLGALSAVPEQDFALKEEERFLELELGTVEGRDFAGQLVKQSGELVYASIFARLSQLV